MCEILDLKGNAGQNVKRLEYDEWSTVSVTKDKVRSNQYGSDISNLHYGKYAVVNESGLYALILNSRKPKARAFRRWITHEGIPAIEKTGMYSLDGMTIEQKILEQAKVIVSLDEQRKRLQEKVVQLQPKAEVFDHFGDHQEGCFKAEFRG